MVQAYLYFAAMIAAHLRGLRYDDAFREGDTSDEPLTVGDAIADAINKQNAIELPRSETPYDVDAAHDLMLALQSQLQSCGFNWMTKTTRRLILPH